LADEKPITGNAGPSMPSPDVAEEMVARIAAAQRPLFSYIRTLVAPWGSPEDVLQEVNLVLWRKASEFDGRGEFLTWACRIAYLQVLAHRKVVNRTRFVALDDGILADLSQRLIDRVRDTDIRLDALRACLELLAPTARRLIAQRYEEGGSVRAAAESVGRAPESVRVTLHRIRKTLLACMQGRLAEGNA